MPVPDGPQFPRHLYHYSAEAPDEFMSAPTVHAGSLSQASDRASFFRGNIPHIREYGVDGSVRAGVYEITPSQHIEVHPEVLEDDEANAADMRFLKKNNYPVPESVEHSIGPQYDYQAARRIVRAAKALSSNKAVAYDNFSEGGGRSFVIPAPHFNAGVTGKLETNDGVVSDEIETWNAPDPHTQTPLPMDYTPMKKSRRTTAYRGA